MALPVTESPSSGLSSPLSYLSSSPQPPSCLNYPSPDSSQGSFTEELPRSQQTTHDDDSGAPPCKKRKIAEPKPRTTQRINLAQEDIFEGQKEPLTRLISLLRKRKKIVVIAGAGISVSAGIPDFRSTHGLFNSLRKEHNLKGSGMQLFDASVYRDGPSTASFHTMVRSLSKISKSAEPTAFHHFVASLAHEDRLLRLYTQNVDGLETSIEPLQTTVPLLNKRPFPKTIQLHGGINKMVCCKCGELSDFKPSLFDGPIPPSCEACVTHEEVREGCGQRGRGIGKLRPRLVLYNEHNPDEDAIGAVTQDDLRTRPDAIIVVGTTLKVPGVRRIAREMCRVVRGRRGGTSVWINNDPEPPGKDLENCWDFVVTGTSDQVARVVNLPRWDAASGLEVSDEIALRAKEAAKDIQVVIQSHHHQDRNKIVADYTPDSTPCRETVSVVVPVATSTLSSTPTAKPNILKKSGLIKSSSAKPKPARAPNAKKTSRRPAARSQEKPTIKRINLKVVKRPQSGKDKDSMAALHKLDNGDASPNVDVRRPQTALGAAIQPPPS